MKLFHKTSEGYTWRGAQEGGIMFKRIFSGIEIAQGGIIPNWYGVSYYLPDRDIAVCYPLPFNKIVRFFRDLYWWTYFKVGRPSGVSKIEMMMFECHKDAYCEGYESAFTKYIHDFLTSEHAYHKGFKEGREFAFKTMGETLKSTDKTKNSEL